MLATLDVGLALCGGVAIGAVATLALILLLVALYRQGQ